jgi:CheY-like chemotaxis protein
MRNKLQLLIIEDEPAILAGLIDLFVYHGYEVEAAQDGRVGLDKALAGAYDLIILDIMLPTLDGFALCNAIRQHNREQPLIILTAKTTEEDIITGLTLGADDYVGKPFAFLSWCCGRKLCCAAPPNCGNNRPSCGLGSSTSTPEIHCTQAQRCVPVPSRQEIEISISAAQRPSGLPGRTACGSLGRAQKRAP